MPSLHLIETLDHLASTPSGHNISSLPPEQFQWEAPDAHWVLQDDEALRARCSLWWQRTPTLPGKTLGVVGHYAADDAAGAIAILEHAQTELARQGCTYVVGPMDGNTWQRYRLVSKSPSDGKPEPPFFLEPINPESWNQHFLRTGFQPLATYSSALNPNLSQRDARMETVAIRLKHQGVQVRSLDLSKFEDELRRIHTLSCESFQRNFLYTPISVEAFSLQYAKVQPYVRPEFILLAEKATGVLSNDQAPELVGFLFAVPDWLAAQRGEALTTLIVKTVAVKPGRAYAGLGSYLVDQVQAIAHQQGYTRAIHALMYDQNPSRNISDRFAEPIRRYTLYGKEL
ncbi:GNAT family N-acetyltransferase [Vacuolonema iberomarrocanum]|uniref:GNAT family N-acetyltransferase n=1 Tax=Vacuolonema iberomarrocanum TaxID=3454632 RepID=UPI0019FABC58|nr:GNAT family N-acetyltransferase [filamentous cyanobacterium LEGE 07170]